MLDYRTQTFKIRGERLPIWVALLLIVLGVVGGLSVTYVYLYPHLSHENIMSCVLRSAAAPAPSCATLMRPKSRTQLAAMPASHVVKISKVEL